MAAGGQALLLCLRMGPDDLIAERGEEGRLTRQEKRFRFKQCPITRPEKSRRFGKTLVTLGPFDKFKVDDFACPTIFINIVCGRAQQQKM